jgi:hypothetical protein
VKKKSDEDLLPKTFGEADRTRKGIPTDMLLTLGRRTVTRRPDRKGNFEGEDRQAASAGSQEKHH